MGILKPDIVFFGESLPDTFHPSINADRLVCDCLVVIGSSLKVRPVSLLPEFVREDVPQILINRERVGSYVFDVELLGDADVIVNQLCHMIGGDWAEICQQPPLSQAFSLEYDPVTIDKLDLPSNRRIPKFVELMDLTFKNKTESQSQNTTENDDSNLMPTESNIDKKPEKLGGSSTGSSDKLLEPSTSSKEESNEENDEEILPESAFIFSVDNIPNGCYYMTHPNKFIFPGSTYRWYGTGNSDRDKILFDDEMTLEIEFDEDETSTTGSSTNRDSSPIIIESSDSDDARSMKQSDSSKLGKRLGEVEIDEGVSPVKQQKIIDE